MTARVTKSFIVTIAGEEQARPAAASETDPPSTSTSEARSQCAPTSKALLSSARDAFTVQTPCESLLAMPPRRISAWVPPCSVSPDAGGQTCTAEAPHPLTQRAGVKDGIGWNQVCPTSFHGKPAPEGASQRRWLARVGDAGRCACTRSPRHASSDACRIPCRHRSVLPRGRSLSLQLDYHEPTAEPS